MKPSFEKFLEEHKGDFPLEKPSEGHSNRFEQKLDSDSDPDKESGSSDNKFYRNFLSIAASIVLIFSIYGIWKFYDVNPSESAFQTNVDSYKPEDLRNTEKTIAYTVEDQKEELITHEGRNSELVKNTLQELNQLEQDYTEMEKDLMVSGNEKVIEAMQKNLEMRTEILKKTHQYLEENRK